MTERLRVCKVCTNRKMDLKTGMVCGLTDAKPAFEETCPDYKEDAAEMGIRTWQVGRDGLGDDTEADGTPKKGNAGKGIVMMIIGVILLLVFLAMGRISFISIALIIGGAVQIARSSNQTYVGGQRSEPKN